MLHLSLTHPQDSSHLLLSSPALEPIKAPFLLACKRLEPSCNPNAYYSPSRKQELQTSLVSSETCCCLICVWQLTTAALPLQPTNKYNLHSHMGKRSLIPSPPPSSSSYVLSFLLTSWDFLLSFLVPGCGYCSRLLHMLPSPLP